MFFLNKKKNKKTDILDQVLRNPKILDVNLIKDEVSLDFDWKRNMKTFGIMFVVVAILIVELYLGLDWWQKDEEARLEQVRVDTKKVSQEVNDFRKSAAGALSFKDKTMDVDSLLKNHIYWTNFFSWLEKNTLSTVSYGGFSGTLDGKYSLSGTAGSFADVSWQVKTLLEDPMTLKASVASVNAGAAKSKAELATEESARLEAAKKEAAASGSDSTQAPVVVKPVETIVPGVGFNLMLEVNPEIFNK